MVRAYVAGIHGLVNTISGWRWRISSNTGAATKSNRGMLLFYNRS
jgi:hypothetical protein